jgi:chromosome segregation ATPase
MQTKSRYEVVAELEEKKRNLIRERDSLDKVLLSMKKELKELKREIEDKEEEITEFESSMEDSKKTIQTLIESVDESLNRFSERKVFKGEL